MSAPTLAQKVSNIKHMPVLLAATSATKDPADGYLVKDIIKMSFESYQTRLFLLQYLVNQLITSNNVYSKIKILRLFLVLLEEGHVEFKQTLRKTPEPFNEAAKLRPNQPKDQKLVSECGRIRDMANKVLDMLYSEVPEMRSRPHPNPSFDSSTVSSESSNGGGTRITGFGNTAPPKPSTGDKLKALFGTAGKPNTVVYDANYATMDPVPHNASANSPFTVHVPNTGGAKRYQGSDGVPSGLPHERGQAGGGWSSNNQPTSYKPTTTTTKQQWTPPQLRLADEEEEREHLSSTGEDLSSYGHTGIEQEQKLVDDITAPGGVRAAPPRESLNKFITRCKVLDALSVVDCLRLKLLSDESQVVLRALFVIETLLRSDIPDVLSHLDIVLQDLSDLTSSQNSSIQAKAKKILVQLTSANAERVSDQHVLTQQSSRGGRDGQGMEEGGEREEEEEEEEEADSSGVSSIFSGLSVSGEKSSHKPAGKKKKKKAKPQPSGTRAAIARATKPSPGPARKEREEKNGFEDILGLGDLSVAGGADSQVTEAVQGEVSQRQQQELMSYEDLAVEEDNSLLTFEEDVEFDPLKRSDSLAGRSGSLSKRNGSVGKRPPSATNTNHAPLAEQSMEVATLSNRASTTVKPPLTSRESLGHIQDLTGIDLTGSSLSSAAPREARQEGFGAGGANEMMLHPFQISSAGSTMPPMNMVIASSAGMMPHPQGGVQMVAAPVGGQGQVPLAGLQGGMAYGGVAPAMQGGLAYGGGGAAMVPMVYAAQGNAGMMYQPQFGGVARPVQRAAVSSKEQTPPLDTSFSFLGKSNKSNAFDFVQDEMKATRTSKK